MQPTSPSFTRPVCRRLLGFFILAGFTSTPLMATEPGGVIEALGALPFKFTNGVLRIFAQSGHVLAGTLAPAEVFLPLAWNTMVQSRCRL
jgi:hypothetical protein